MKRRYRILGVLGGLALASMTVLAVVLSHDRACVDAPVSAMTADAPPMQAVVYRCYGGSEVLKLEAVARPVPADDGVRVRVHAAAVNPLDKHFMRGKPYFMRLSTGIGAPDDIRMGVDFAGVVEAVGKDVTRFKPGDAVFGGAAGAFGEYVTVSEHRAIVPMPGNIDFAQAAAVPIAAITALQALRDKGGLQAGQRVLINGASGGVGSFAVQIAKAMGAEVTGVSSTRNLAMVQSLGADQVIDYTRANFTRSGQRYDLIVDTVANHPLSALRGALTPTGALVMVGGGGGNWLGPLQRLLVSQLLAPFVDQRLEPLMAELNQADLQFLADLIAQGKLTSVIDRRFRLDEVPAAIDHLETGRVRGKLIIEVIAPSLAQAEARAASN